MGILLILIVLVVFFLVMNKTTREKLKQIWILMLVIGIILILVFVALLTRKNMLRSSVAKIDEEYWRIVHLESYQDVRRATRNNEIDEDELSEQYMDIEGVMLDVDEFGLKNSKYSNQERFLEHFDTAYPEKTHMYTFLIIGIVLIIGAIIMKRTKKFLIDLHKIDDKQI